jgi:hypothetical protein
VKEKLPVKLGWKRTTTPITLKCTDREDANTFRSETGGNLCGEMESCSIREVGRTQIIKGLYFAKGGTYHVFRKFIDCPTRILILEWART